MRFHLGAIPEPQDFTPEQEGWRTIREPTPGMMQLWVIPLVIVVVGALAALFVCCTPFSIAGISLWQALLLVLLSIPVHELIHAVAHPGQGRTPASILGFWPSRLLFYAHYEQAFSRNRFVLILGLPFVMLSVVPLLYAIVLQEGWWGLMVLSVVNGATSCGDLLGILLVVFQIPGRASVRNKGWRSFWRPPPHQGG